MIKDAEVLSILVADDHKLLTDLLARMLQAESGFNVTVAGTFKDAQCQIDDKNGFDVALVDLKMPGMNGLASLLALGTANEHGATVIFAGMASSLMVKSAIEGGIRGYIPKVTSLKTLPSIIRLIASGEVYVPHEMSPATGRITEKVTAVGMKLSEREIAVLRLAAEGRTNKSIAWEIGETEVIVKMVMRNICTKLGAQNRTQASMIAAENGVI